MIQATAPVEQLGELKRALVQWFHVVRDVMHRVAGRMVKRDPQAERQCQRRPPLSGYVLVTIGGRSCVVPVESCVSHGQASSVNTETCANVHVIFKLARLCWRRRASASSYRWPRFESNTRTPVQLSLFASINCK